MKIENRILVVDDEPSITDGLRLLLGAAEPGELEAEAETHGRTEPGAPNAGAPDPGRAQRYLRAGALLAHDARAIRRAVGLRDASPR